MSEGTPYVMDRSPRPAVAESLQTSEYSENLIQQIRNLL